MTYRGGGRYEKLVVLMHMDLTKNGGGPRGSILSELPKVGGAIATPVLQPITYNLLVVYDFNLC